MAGPTASRWLMASATVIAVVTGCASPPRDGARLLAAYTKSVQSRSERFATHRNELARHRLRNVEALETARFRVAEGNERQRSILVASRDADRIALLKAVSEAADAAAAQRRADAEAIARRSAELETLAPAVQVRSSDLGGTSKALGELAERPGVWARTRFLVDFVADVWRESQEAEDEAEKAADAASQTAASLIAEETENAGKAK